MDKPDLSGLILAGGQSQRMGCDKGRIIYSKLSPLEQRQRLHFIFQKLEMQSYLSCRSVQSYPEEMDVILDHPDFEGGPGVGILSAHKKNPKAAWLVVACDFPFVDSRGIEELISNRIGNGISTVYKNIENSIEPLFAIWEPETLINFMNIFENGEKSPRRFLERSNPKTLAPHDPRLLVNINSLRDAEPYPELQRL